MSMNGNFDNKNYFDGQLNELVSQLSQQGIEPTGGTTGGATGGDRRRTGGEVQPTPNPSKGKLHRIFQSSFIILHLLLLPVRTRTFILKY